MKSYLKQRVKFPCGYEHEIVASSDSSFWDMGKVNIDVDPINQETLMICPLHGKNCPNQKKGGR